MKNNYKFLLIILLVIFIVPQVALASWWNPFSWGIWNRIFHFQRTEQKQEQKQEQPEIQLETNNSTSSADSSVDQNSSSTKSITTDWKTYTNTQYGFEFKYPKDFIIGKGKSGAINVWTPEKKKEFDANNEMQVYPEFSIIYWEKPLFLASASEATKKNITNVKDFVLEQFTAHLETTRDGKQAYAGIVSGKDAAYIEYTESNNGVFVITVSYPDNAATDDIKNAQMSINGKILSSLKFTK